MIFGGFNDIPTEDFRRVLETNLFGIIYGSRAAVHQFRMRHSTINLTLVV
jgi:NAD(P)-dependent dehydrogenase (short-subunit alcohol dehydrogenase family)